MRFTQAYAGSPVCAPSRCTLMTGRHSGHCTIRFNGPILNDEDVTVAQVLSDQGYDTILVGKWGMGGIGSSGYPTKKGFHQFYGQTSQLNCHNYYPPFMWRNEEKEEIKNNKLASRLTCGHDFDGCDWSGDLWTREAVDYLDRHAEKRHLQRINGEDETPFFMFLSYTAPHAGDVGSIRETGEPVPRISKSPYSNETISWGREVEYAAAVTEIDRQVGIVVDKIDKLGLDEDTIIFFASDNGASNEGEHDYMFFNSSGILKGYKRSLHEGGIRTPMIARWPGTIPAHTVSEYQFTFYDLLPTAAHLAKAASEDLPTGIDGVSVVNTLLGEYQEEKNYVYHEYCYPIEKQPGWGQALRVGNWSAVCVGKIPENLDQIPTCKVPLIYDLSVDPSQTNDIAHEHPKVVQKMMRLMKEAHGAGGICVNHNTGPAAAVRVHMMNLEDKADWEFFEKYS